MKDLISKRIIWFYILTFGFLLINAYLVYKENYYGFAVPIALLILLISIFSFDKLIYIIVFLIPLSIPLSEIMPGLDINMSLPSEPLIAGILIIFIIKLLWERTFDKKIFFHPISIIILIQIGWMLFTSLTSTMPIVSLKYTLSRMWFVVAFYFLFILLFENVNRFKVVIWLYTLSLTIVIFYTINRHLSFGLFNQEAANFVCYPYYNDHTAYGAALAFIFSALLSFLFLKNYNLLYKWLSFGFLVIITLGIILSYTRATWVSMIIAFSFLMIMLFKIKFRTLIIIGLIIIGTIGLFWKDIIMNLEQNTQDSSANLTEQIQSITNISTDASNVERINRWNCAIRMFKEKPIFGWGPGTYMFQYAPFQRSNEKTIISTNTADGGNAHSEYLGPLAESGFIGSILMLILIIYTLYVSVSIYHRKIDKNLRILALASLMGLITYYVHGILNNFLDTDKLSVLFWGFTALIVAIDIKTKPQKDKIKPID